MNPPLPPAVPLPAEISGRLTRRDALQPEQVSAMLSLFQAHFLDVDDQVFLEDIAEKEWVILLENRAGEILGFSTMMLYHTEFRGETISVLFSGDTIVDERARRNPALAITWLGAMDTLRKERAKGRFYWFLICSGYRTYRFLPVFFREYFPRHDRETPPEIRALISHIAKERYGELYNPESGLLTLPGRQVPLRPGVSDVTPNRLKNPQVRFFLSKNPGHAMGDELVCLTEADPANLKRSGVKLLANFWAGQ